MERTSVCNRILSPRVCGLCEKKAILSQSHIIPKFVFRWIKQTSATGKLRQSVNVGKRLQDGIKKRAYCLDCERIFSKHEVYFSGHIFYPYVNQDENVFTYDERLKKFIVGLAFKILQQDAESFLKDNPKWSEALLGTINSWREYLLCNAPDVEEDVHLFFIGEVDDFQGFNYSQAKWYFCRATDATVVFGENQLSVYVLLPKLILVVAISPKTSEGWSGTKIRTEGAIAPPQLIPHPFVDFLRNRLGIINKNVMSERDQRKVMDEIMSNWSSVADSETVKLMFRIMEKKK